MRYLVNYKFCIVINPSLCFLCCEFIKFTFKYTFKILHFPVFNLIIKTFPWHWEGFGPLDSHDLGFEPQDGYPLNQHRHVFLQIVILPQIFHRHKGGFRAMLVYSQSVLVFIV